MHFYRIRVDMHIVKSKFKAASGKVYETILLRESYREGKKVKKRTVANLTNCSSQEISAIELALKYKSNLQALCPHNSPTVTEGLSVGSVWAVYKVAEQLGIVDALGYSRPGQLAIWQVIARVIEQGSRLSAVRLAETYAIASVIGLEKGFNEEDLYKNLFWLSKNQTSIEDHLFTKQASNEKPTLFLYDVTSSYLEGQENELADWGYNRDKKKGKKQIVIGLLSNAHGTPISTEVFKGNTQDLSTFAPQVQKAKERFKCDRITIVGDRGMIKSGQIEDLQEHGYHYITAITKAQIETLLKTGIIQLTLFDDPICEVQDSGVRYILRRNPIRTQELAAVRSSKQKRIEGILEKENTYLSEHARAQVRTALQAVNSKIAQFKLQGWLSVAVEGRKLTLSIDEEAKAEEAKLDGCYVIKTDLQKIDASSQEIHDRYKDLKMVESAFRTVKSDLEIRPVYVTTEGSTRGHVLVVMLAYMIIQELDRRWKHLYLTVEEGLRSLATLTLIKISYGDKSFQQIPEPRDNNKAMLEATNVILPKILPKSSAHVVTRKPRRKSFARI
jgi:transposase